MLYKKISVAVGDKAVQLLDTLAEILGIWIDSDIVYR